MVDYSYYLLIGAVLFVVGLVGFITRRNLILIFLCTELMLHGVILNLVGFNRMWLIQTGQASYEGQAFAIFLMVIAAAEAALAMALVMVLQRRRNTLDAGVFAEMKG